MKNIYCYTLYTEYKQYVIDEMISFTIVWKSQIQIDHGLFMMFMSLWPMVSKCMRYWSLVFNEVLLKIYPVNWNIFYQNISRNLDKLNSLEWKWLFDELNSNPIENIIFHLIISNITTVREEF